MILVVEDYELNLSLKEYFYYQECPQKFRFYRILNPLPNKEVFLTDKRSIEEYRKRGYSDNEMNGIKLHQFFANFHQKYYLSIENNLVPKEFAVEHIKLLFWKYQQIRYQKSIGEFSWTPLWTELSIMSKTQRGIIDCIELTNNDEELRIIDYKKNKHKNDLESLYFYALLLEDYMNEMNCEGLKIGEIGCYYYLNGELNVEEYDFVIKNKIIEKINCILIEIRSENFILKKANCSNCVLQIVCKIQNQ